MSIVRRLISDKPKKEEYTLESTLFQLGEADAESFVFPAPAKKRQLADSGGKRKAAAAKRQPLEVEVPAMENMQKSGGDGEAEKAEAEAEEKKKVICEEESPAPVPEQTRQQLAQQHLLGFSEYERLREEYYTVDQLRYMCACYHLRTANAKKNDLVRRLYAYLRCSARFAVPLQAWARGRFVRKYFESHGPAFRDRSLCTNTEDFYTMDELTDIPMQQFFSFQNKTGFVYGFDILSIHKLWRREVLAKKEALRTEQARRGGSGGGDNVMTTAGGSDNNKTCKVSVKNPYDNQLIPSYALRAMGDMIRLGHLLHLSPVLAVKEKKLPPEKTVEMNAVTLFQGINALGHYADAMWFMELDARQLQFMEQYLADVWFRRAGLSEAVRRRICPRGGVGQRIPMLMQRLGDRVSLDDMRAAVMTSMDALVFSGTTLDDRGLGAYYVLGALTMVSRTAAAAMPWLYEAMV